MIKQWCGEGLGSSFCSRLPHSKLHVRQHIFQRATTSPNQATKNQPECGAAPPHFNKALASNQHTHFDFLRSHSELTSDHPHVVGILVNHLRHRNSLHQQLAIPLFAQASELQHGHHQPSVQNDNGPRPATRHLPHGIPTTAKVSARCGPRNTALRRSLPTPHVQLGSSLRQQTYDCYAELGA
jgi:hypothetical protein